jgi:hypothetical protein
MARLGKNDWFSSSQVKASPPTSFVQVQVNAKMYVIAELILRPFHFPNGSKAPVTAKIERVV